MPKDSADKLWEKWKDKIPCPGHNTMSSETKEKIESVEESIKEVVELRFGHIREKLDAIHEQTTKTNGRVSTLETWKNKLIGALIITELLLLPIAVAKVLELIKNV